MSDVLSWDSQHLLWGYVVLGDMAEFSAVIAEGQDWPEFTRNRCPAWDRTASYLNSIESWKDGERQPLPWWWALPGVCEQRLRKETAA